MSHFLMFHSNFAVRYLNAKYVWTKSKDNLCKFLQ